MIIFKVNDEALAFRPSSNISIIADRVMRTRKQRGVRQILKVCKEHASVCIVNTRLQNSVTSNNILFIF